ncbi:hypothetical protein EIP86_006238 [Pleurotus ostreatoroseus]|nr:hypothetical protein EIP86_006238 [Pleurotus ostreatoroseus]
MHPDDPPSYDEAASPPEQLNEHAHDAPVSLSRTPSPEPPEPAAHGVASTATTSNATAPGPHVGIAPEGPPALNPHQAPPPVHGLLVATSSNPQTALAFPAALTATFPEPALRGSIPIRVHPRCGIVGGSDKVEWRLLAKPLLPITTGRRVALCDATGTYRFLSRTVGPVVGADQHWVTFVLSAGISAPATTPPCRGSSESSSSAWLFSSPMNTRSSPPIYRT